MDEGAAARAWQARRVAAVLAVLLAGGCLLFAYLATRSFVETYGLGGDTSQVLIAIGVIVGTITAGLALLARRLVRRRVPGPFSFVALGVMLVVGSVALGAALGQRDWSRACEAGTVACEPQEPDG